MTPDTPTLPPDDLACTEEVELITDYLEGALPEAKREQLELHLETCPGCTEYVEQMRAIAGSLGGLRDEQPVSPELRRAVLESFRARRP
jgi:anti-sigma factor RsiW